MIVLRFVKFLSYLVFASLLEHQSITGLQMMGIATAINPEITYK
jgi:hypothetical protein